MNEQLQPQGRVAFRVEGDNWNAYWALPDTMEGAIYLASIRMGAVRGAPHVKDAFMDVVRAAVVALFAQDGVAVDSWSGPQSAPETERSGNA